ncbi:AI-2E family transporter [Granulibacter bethesdensis]|uniref:AI-2E family transporter n=1 Tax=Granulibacter bethesdensis TaxID=364410 RepID=UPI0003F1EE07|nr:AI-2E family transporter [Granulibacter bethesdensis]AHJ66937.1 putative membrane spanning protein [Granulibacter bethesdensis CGDNIH4]
MPDAPSSSSSSLLPPVADNRVRIPAAETPSSNDLRAVVIGVVVVAALYLGREVLVPITLAVLLSFVLSPLVSVLRRLWMPRFIAVVLAVVLALGIILALGGLIGTQLAQLADNVPRYQSTILDKADLLRDWAMTRAGHLAERFGSFGHERSARPPSSQTSTPENQASPTSPAQSTHNQTALPPPQRMADSNLQPHVGREGAGKEVQPVPVTIAPVNPSPLEIAERYLSPIIAPLASTGIVFIVAIFMLMRLEDLRDRMIRLFGSSDLHRTTLAMDDAASRLSRYFLAQLGLNAAFGLITGLGLWMIGVPSPALWGVIAGLMRFVPYIGTPLAAIPPIALAAAVDPGWSMALWAAGMFLVAESMMGQVVEPLLYGHSTGLSPLAVMLSAIFWTWLWGSIGLILSTPLTVCLVVMGRHIPKLEFLDVLLGDRPALTPVESFYQRMLAGDSDEVQDHAEILLRERSLSSYYDEVALKALQLAGRDAQRGVLAPDRVEVILQQVRDLTDELADFDDEALLPEETGVLMAGTAALPQDTHVEPVSAGSYSVVCVAGRGPLDEGAAIMLAQLMAKHGLPARVLSRHAVRGVRIAQTDLGAVDLVCVSYLEVTSRPAHLRMLMQRLRTHAPHAKLMVGLWPTGNPILSDEAQREMIGADYYVTSLRDAVRQAHAAALEQQSGMAA